jgi:undecaprenyl-diphosphatase
VIAPRRVLLAAALCWIGFAVIVALVETGHGARLDAAGLTVWRQSGRAGLPRGPAWLLEAARDFTALGGPLLRNLFALAAVAALLFLRERRRAVLFALTVVLAWVIDAALKALVGRARPALVPHLMAAGGNSFPSGHSFNAAVVYIAMALVFAGFNSRAAVRRTVIGAALILTLLVALTRVWLGVHWPSDALGGWLGGAGWAFLAAAVLRPPARAIAEAAG